MLVVNVLDDVEDMAVLCCLVVGCSFSMSIFDVYFLLFLLDVVEVILVVPFDDVFDVLCFASFLFVDNVDALDACYVSMFDGLLSSFAICISDVDAAGMF